VSFKFQTLSMAGETTSREMSLLQAQFIDSDERSTRLADILPCAAYSSSSFLLFLVSLSLQTRVE